MQPLSGNAGDQASFSALIEAHLAHLQQAIGIDYLVADAALYSAAHLRVLSESGMKFITRVPETLSEVKAVLGQVEHESMEPLTAGYEAVAHRSDYGGVAQRWLVVHSEAAQARAEKTIPRQFARRHEVEQKAFRKLVGRDYSCREDTEHALAAFEAALVASRIEGKQVLECAHATLEAGTALVQKNGAVSYRIQGELMPSCEQQAEMCWRRSLFIVTTNELDESALSNEELLAAYKGQHQVERGFRFLKDPVFLASSLFLKSEKRIMALLMVMTLCLLVYAALEWRIRQGLRQQRRTIPDQKGRPTQRPTARWVFYLFEGIHVLMASRQELVLNLKDHHRVILDVLGPQYQSRYYSHSP